MLSQFERQIFLLHLTPRYYPSSAPDFDIEQFIKVLSKLYQNDESVAYVHPEGKIIGLNEIDEWKKSNSYIENNIIYIADFHNDTTNKKLSILINRADAEVVDPAFVNHQTKTVRLVERRDGEAQAFSAHIVVSYDTSKKIGDSYRAVIERVPTLSQTTILNFLKKIFNKHAEENPEFTYFHEKDKETKYYHPVIDLTKRASAQLKNDLEQGTISSVDLIKREAQEGGIDQLPNIKRVSKKLGIKVENGSMGSSAVSWLNQLRGKAADAGYDEVVVHVSELPQKTSASPRFSTEVQDAADLLYSRCELLNNFSQPLSQCMEYINPETKSQMYLIIDDNTYWS